MILYTVIARSNDGTILAEATTVGIEGNQALVTQQLIQALVKKPSLVSIGNRKTFAHVSSAMEAMKDENNDAYFGLHESNQGTMEIYFHVQRGEDTFYICLSDEKDGHSQRANFRFLLDVQKEFSLLYTPNKIKIANAYAFDKPFRKTLSNLMHYYNTNKDLGSDPLAAKLNAKVESIKQTLDINIELLMGRGVLMQNLMEQSEDLLIESQVFNKRSTALKRAMKKKSLYYKLVLVAFAVLLIYLMVVKFCGFDLSCEANNNSNNSYGNNGSYNQNRNKNNYYNNHYYGNNGGGRARLR